MKTYNHPSIILLLFFILNCIFSYAQTQLPPGISWKRSDRLNAYPSTVTPMTGHVINEEAEDWWYDHKNSYNGGGVDPRDFNGFITCGYSAPRNLEYAETNDGCLSVSFPISPPFVPHLCSDDLDFSNMPDGVYTDPSFQTMGLYDQHGKLKWFKTYNNGWFIRVIQTSDGNYIAVGPTSSTREPDLYTELLYNYNASSNPNEYFGTAICGSNSLRKINVVKIDPNGDIIWNRIYGYSSTYEGGGPVEKFTPYDLIEYNNGGDPSIMVVGDADINGTGNQGFMLDILSSDGSMNKLQLYSPTVGVQRKFTAIEKTIISSNPCFVIVGAEEITSGGDLRIQLYCEDFGGTPQWLQNYSGIGSGGTNSLALDICINSNNDILVPVMYNCNYCKWDGEDTWADADVFKFDVTNGSIIDQYPISNPGAGSPADKIRAYDLKIGITNTDDGGFAIVTSMVTEPYISRYPSYAYGWGCYGNSYDESTWTYWNADAYVIKYDLAGNVEWFKVFDIDDELPAEYPGDQKRQECLYSISETPDGGFVVAGNNSRNFDDCYLVKLYDNCNNNLEYTWDPGEDNIYELSEIGNYLTGTNYLRGSVVIHNGESLNVDGAELRFADTRKCGIITNIVVEPGGTLNIYNGALLTSVEGDCPFSMWDGIQLNGDNTSFQDPSTQPYLYINGSTIENARYGAIADIVEYSTHENWITPNECVIKDLAMGETQSGGGGYVGITYSNFHNSRFSVVLNAYPDFTDYSYIDHTSFYLDGPIKDWDAVNANGDPLGINSFIKLYDVHWVKFESNGFYIDNTLPLLDDDKGNGIGAFDSDFAFWGNNFENLNRGLDAGTSAQVGSFDGSCNTMTDVIHGMKIQNVDGAIIHGNTIGINDGDSHSSFGIYMRDCTGYTIQDNNLTYNSIASNLNEVGFGNYLSYSNNYKNDIRFNTISNFQKSMILEGNQRKSINANDGLKISNNDFRNYTNAISVTLAPGIAGMQDGAGGKADNTFENYTCSTNARQLYNYDPLTSINHVDYYNSGNIPGYYVELQSNCYTSATVTPNTVGTYNPNDYIHALIGCGPSWRINNTGYSTNSNSIARLSSSSQSHPSDSLINETIRGYMHDTTACAIDSLISFLNALPNSSDYQIIINNAIAKLHRSALLQSVNQLPDNEFGSQKTLINLRDTLDWAQIKKSPNAKKLLKTIVSGDSTQYGYSAAKNILYFLFDEPYPEVIISPRDNVALRKSNFQLQQELLLYPNPCFDDLIIRSSSKSIQQVKVSDLYGKILKNDICKSANQYELKLSDLSEGMYIISVLDEDQKWQSFKVNHFTN